MQIRNVIKLGVLRFIADENAGGLKPAVAEEIRRMVSFLQDMELEDGLRTVPSWKAHHLTDGLRGV